METNSVIKGMLERRTIRKYSSANISDEQLNRLLEAAIRVSTMGNMQLYSIIVTRDPAMKEKLAPAHFNQPMVMNAPVVLTFCVDFNRFNKWCLFNGATPGYNNFQSFIAAATDALLVAQQFSAAAESEGLGICYLGTTTYNAGTIIEVLRLPKYVVPITTLTVGVPDGCPEQVERLPLAAVVHEEEYADYDRAQINELYAAKEALPINQGYVKENGKKHLSEVFTDVRYTKANNEAFSELFLNVLKAQGYL